MHNACSHQMAPQSKVSMFNLNTRSISVLIYLVICLWVDYFCKMPYFLPELVIVVTRPAVEFFVAFWTKWCQWKPKFHTHTHTVCLPSKLLRNCINLNPCCIYATTLCNCKVTSYTKSQLEGFISKLYWSLYHKSFNDSGTQYISDL